MEGQTDRKKGTNGERNRPLCNASSLNESGIINILNHHCMCVYTHCVPRCVCVYLCWVQFSFSHQHGVDFGSDGSSSIQSSRGRSSLVPFTTPPGGDTTHISKLFCLSSERIVTVRLRFCSLFFLICYLWLSQSLRLNSKIIFFPPFPWIFLYFLI